MVAQALVVLHHVINVYYEKDRTEFRAIGRFLSCFGPAVRIFKYPCIVASYLGVLVVCSG